MCICLSNLPGLKRASSRRSNLLVAPIIIMFESLLKPSISTSNWFSVWSFSLLLSRWRFAPIASISSINIMLGASFLAFSNNVLTLFAPTPTYFSTNSEPVTLKKEELVSPATADANKVLPVPGGP